MFTKDVMISMTILVIILSGIAYGVSQYNNHYVYPDDMEEAYDLVNVQITNNSTMSEKVSITKSSCEIYVDYYYQQQCIKDILFRVK